MNRRRLLLLALLVTLVVLVAVGWLLWRRTTITEENAGKIQPGMSLEAVEALLGGPARNESDMPDNFINDAFVVNGMRGIEPFAEKRWASPGFLVVVDFDDSWRVVRHSKFSFNVDRSLFDKLRRWLHL